MAQRFLAATVVMLGLWRVAAAQESPLSLSRGTWNAQAYAACAAARHEAMPSANFGIGYFVLNQLSVNVEAAGYGVFQDGPDAGAGEARLLLRHHFFVRDPWTVFADVGEGFFEASERVPEGGTRFNFVFRSGLGVGYELKDGMYLIGGVRYWHLSNAKLEGAQRNPALNGVEGYVGVMWTWK